MADLPAFLLYPDREHAAARDIGYVRALAEWLEWEQSEALRAIQMLVRARQFDQAAVTQAKHDALGEVLLRMAGGTEPPIQETPEEEYEHPNMPRSARKK